MPWAPKIWCFSEGVCEVFTRHNWNLEVLNLRKDFCISQLQVIRIRDLLSTAYNCCSFKRVYVSFAFILVSSDQHSCWRLLKQLLSDCEEVAKWWSFIKSFYWGISLNKNAAAFSIHSSEGKRFIILFFHFSLFTFFSVIVFFAIFDAQSLYWSEINFSWRHVVPYCHVLSRNKLFTIVSAHDPSSLRLKRNGSPFSCLRCTFLFLTCLEYVKLRRRVLAL